MRQHLAVALFQYIPMPCQQNIQTTNSIQQNPPQKAAKIARETTGICANFILSPMP